MVIGLLLVTVTAAFLVIVTEDIAASALVWVRVG